MRSDSWEHVYQGDTTIKRLVSFGFEKPSIGKFEGDRFDPRTWRPQTPTTAYMELGDDDAFWAARRVAAFNREMIAAMIHAGEFSDASAGLPKEVGSFVAVDIAADGTDYQSWRRPVRAYFRRHAEGWKLVGLDRLPRRAGTVVASRR
jgi:hypothetical protein